MIPAQRPKPVVDTPGIYPMSAEEYHADPIPGRSLSSSGARKLRPPSCPAKFRHQLDHPSEPTADFDTGHAAHKLVLGEGPDIIPVPYEDWKTRAARDLRDQIHAEGAVPLLERQYQQVQDMAVVLRRDPIASRLLDPAAGDPEQNLFWIDDDSGIWCRARVDWLPRKVDGRRLILVDYKTGKRADIDGISKSTADYGYHQQADWYVSGAKALGLDPDPGFVFIFQEKEPPYLITPITLTAFALKIGNYENRKAITTYQECMTTDTWPGYTDGIETVSLPPWVENRYEQEIS